MCTLHLSKKLTTYKTSNSGITLHFADNTTATADVFVGADGIKSVVRDKMFQQLLADQHKAYEASGSQGPPPEFCPQAVPKWTGTVAYRALIPNDLAVPKPQMYAGIGKHLVCYPISQGKMLNIVAYETVPGGEGTPYPGAWFEEAPPEYIVALLDGWEPEVQAIVKVNLPFVVLFPNSGRHPTLAGSPSTK